MPHPINLEFSKGIRFQDNGTAFVSALEDRQSSFGSLRVKDDMPLDDVNLKRLLKVNNIEKLELPILKDELLLLPFSAPVKSLEYTINELSALGKGIDSVNIVAKELSIRIKSVNRSTIYDNNGCLAGAGMNLILGIRSNQTLEVLKLRGGEYWEDYIEEMLWMLGDHRTIHTLILEACPKHDMAGFWLYDLLERNRRVQVVDTEGKRFGNDGIRELYSLNHFYCGSADLKGEHQEIRSALVGRALVDRASNDFQRSALLLADHADILCELDLTTSTFLALADLIKELIDIGDESLEAQEYIRQMLLNEVLPTARDIRDGSSQRRRLDTPVQVPIESLWEVIDGCLKRSLSEDDDLSLAKKSKISNAGDSDENIA